MGLGGILVLGRTELAGGGCLLLELLLLLSVGEADLNSVLFTADVDLVVVELFDDFLADRSGLETGKTVRVETMMGTAKRLTEQSRLHDRYRSCRGGFWPSRPCEE